MMSRWTARLVFLLALTMSTGVAAQIDLQNDPSRFLGVPVPNEVVTSVHPDAIYACGGPVLVAWSEERGDGAGQRIIARSFFPDGTPASGRLVVAEGSAGLGREPRVLRVGGARLAVAWISTDGTDTVRIAKLKPNGTEFSQPVDVVSGVAGGEFWAFGPLTVGIDRVGVVARNRRGQLVSHLLNDAFRPLAPPVVLGGKERSQVDIKASWSSTFYMAWVEDQGGRRGQDVYVEAFAFNGTSLSPRRMVNTDLVGDQFDPAIGTGGPDGNTVAVTWSASGIESPLDVFVRLFDETLNATSPEVWVDRQLPLPLSWVEEGDDPDVAITSNGAIAIGFRFKTFGDLGDPPNAAVALLGPRLDLRQRRWVAHPNGAFGVHRRPVIATAPCDSNGAATMVWELHYDPFAESPFPTMFRPTAGMSQFTALSPGALVLERESFEALESDGVAHVEVSRSLGGRGEVSVSYSVVSGTAQVETDFIAAEGRLTWADGDLGVKSFEIEMIQDGLGEGSEFANVVFFDPSPGFELPVAERRFFLHEIEAGNPGRPSFMLGPHEFFEDVGTIEILVDRVDGATGPLAFDWTVERLEGLKFGVDLLTTGGTIEWASGDRTPQPIRIDVVDDGRVEPVGFFSVAVRAPGSGSVGNTVASTSVHLFDDDPPLAGTIEVVEPLVTTGESNGLVRLWVERRGGAQGAVVVEYSLGYTGDDLLGLPVINQLRWPDGDATPKSIDIDPLWDDREPVEFQSDSASVELIRVVEGDARLGAETRSDVIVIDDDEVPFEPFVRLSAGDVGCSAVRLSILAPHTTVIPASGGRSCWMNLATAPSGDPTAVTTCRDDAGFPVVLSFSVDGEESTLLSNPRRPQIDTFSATRNRVASDLVAPGSPDAIVVEIVPTIDPAIALPAELIRIDNFDPGTPASAKPGRALSPIAASCHEQTPRDAHVMSVLSRLIEPLDDGGDSRRLTIFRGQDPRHYWIEQIPERFEGSPRLRTLISAVVLFDPTTDSLSKMWLSAFTCNDDGGGCGPVPGRSGLWIAAPAPRLGEPAATFGSFVFERGRVVEIDLSTLLQETTWGTFQ